MTTWEVIEDALAHKKPRRNPQWLAEQLGVTIQVVSNWKARGVPARRYREIATAVGITVDQLEGIEPLPWAKEFEWPFSSQLQERVQRLRSDELCLLEKSIWDYLKEPAPVVVQEQLRKALTHADSMSLPGMGVTQITNENKENTKS